MRLRNFFSGRAFGLLLTAAGLAALTHAVHANPKGGQVTNGGITITESPGVMTINQSTPRGIIHWQDFSIGAGELTQFQHLDSKSATLNRVVGGIPSTIMGTLQANGQVYLVNPNGILVGPTGVINTAAFVASTLDVPDAQFLAGGNMQFSGNSLAGVVNFGSITATDGDVILLGHYVQNAGTINAPNGVVALAAGNDILFQPAGDERVVVNSGIPGGGTGVENTGSINAAQAELKAAGGNVYALAVNNTGVVKATGIAQMNGRVILSSEGGVVQNSGQLIAKNADGSGGTVKMSSGKGGTTINNGSIDASADNAQKNGGTVELTGDTVTVGSSSVINVSGLNGGTAAIGISAATAAQTTASGGIATLALDPTAQAAQQATIQANSRILANSTSAGSGGRVVVWSEKQSVIGGDIQANGGTLGGDGGLVETSGRIGLTIIPGTKVSTAAPKGKAGTWLLDPASGISIDTSASDTANGNSSPFTQNAPGNHVNAADIVIALGGGNVTVTTTSGDISVNTAIPIPTALGGAHTLELDSAAGININNPIGGAASDVILQMQSHGDISVASGATVQMNGISAYAISGSINVADQITANNNQNIYLTAPAGSIGFTGSGKANASSTGTVYLDTHNHNVNNAGTITSSGPAAAVVAGNLDIWSGPQGVATSGSPFLTVVDNLVATVDPQIASGPTVFASSGGGVYISNSSGGTLHIGGVTALPGQPAAGILGASISGFGGVELKNNAGNIRIDSVTNERITAWGDIKLTVIGNYDIQILNIGQNSIRTRNGSVTLTTGGNVLIGDAGSNIWGINVRGQTGVTVQAGGDVTVAGSLLKSIGGSGVSVTAGGDVNVLTSSGFAAIIGTSGGAPISITTGAGKTFNNNTLSNGGVLTTITTALDESPPNTPSAGGDITIKADLMTINSPINAGTGTVTLDPVGIHRAIDVGTKTAGELGFTATELGRITTAVLRIGSFASDGDLTVSAPFTAAQIMDLQLSSGGNVLPYLAITLQSGSTLTLRATGNIGDNFSGSGNITASGLVATTTNGYISLGGFGILTLGSVNFTAGSYAYIGGANSPIYNISNSVSTGAFQVISSVDLTLIGNNQAGTSAFLNTGGNLLFAPGASLGIAAGADFVLPHGNFINNSGPTAVNGTGRIIVWEKDPFGAHNEGSLPASDYGINAGPVGATVNYPNDPLGAGNVFYFTSFTPPVLAPSSFPVISAPRLFTALPPPTTAQTLTEFRHYLSTLTLEQLVALTADKSITSDPIKGPELLSQVTVLNTYAHHPLSQAAQDAIVHDAAVAIQASSNAIEAQKRAVLSAKLAPTVLDMNDPSTLGAFTGGTIEAILAKVNLSSFSVDQLTLMSRDQILSMLGSAGVHLSPADQKAALNATVSQDQLSAIVHSGNGLTSTQFASIVAAGAGNLTVNQIIAAGAGNVISNDGGSFKVLDRNGNVISNDGGSMTVFELAKVISNDGGSVISHDGGTVISHDGGTVISNDGGSLLGQDSAGLLKATMGLISQDSAGILRGNSQLIGNAGGLLGQDSAGLLGQDSAGLARLATAGVVSNSSSTVVSNSSSTLLQNAAGVVSNSSSTLVKPNGAGIISDNSEGFSQLNGMGFSNPAMNLRPVGN